MSCDGLVKNSRLSWALFFERLELTIFLWGSGEFQIHRDKCERSDPRSQWFHVFFSPILSGRRIEAMKSHERIWQKPRVPGIEWFRVFPLEWFFRGRWVAILMFRAWPNSRGLLVLVPMAFASTCLEDAIPASERWDLVAWRKTGKPRGHAFTSGEAAVRTFVFLDTWNSHPVFLPNSPFVYLLFTGKTVPQVTKG